MRQLTSKQKKLLDTWYEQHWKELMQAGGVLWFQIDNCEFFPPELLDKLEEINDTEILYQEINRYISDKGMDEERLHIKRNGDNTMELSKKGETN